MPFKKGNKYGNGRPKGSPNVVKRPMSEALVQLGQGEFDSGKVQRELDSLSGKDYIDAISRLLPYMVAKPTQSVDIETNAPFQITLTSPISRDE